MADASGHLRVEVVSPERVLFSGEARQVITRTLGGGEIAFLPGHSLTDGTVQDIAVHLGFVEVGPDHVSILSDAAELAQDIDVTRAAEAKRRAEEQLRTEHSAEGEAALRRAHARLSATGGLGASH